MLALLADMAALMENYDVFPRIRDSALLSSCAAILPLIMTSQEIRVKQVNYFFFFFFWESGQQPAAAATAAFWKVSIGNTCSD